MKRNIRTFGQFTRARLNEQMEFEGGSSMATVAVVKFPNGDIELHFISDPEDFERSMDPTMMDMDPEIKYFSIESLDDAQIKIHGSDIFHDGSASEY